ncbi:MAG: serine/threonine-protein kinase, partial [Planctomycetota bacterium]|nr:serine/threonine-protein kinase [Planctomycetota bacterium]
MQLTDADRNLARVMLEQRLVDQNGLRQLAFQAEQQGISFEQIVQNSGLWPQQGHAHKPRRASSKLVMENSLKHEFGASPNPNQQNTPAPAPETNKVYTTLPSALTVQGVPASELMKMHSAPPQAPAPTAAPGNDPGTDYGSATPSTKNHGSSQGSSHGSSTPSTNSGTAKRTGSQNGSAGINNSLVDTSSGNIKRVAGELKNLGPYEIVGELGRGAMGIVYKAKHSRLNRFCALKVLIAGEDASESALQRFVSEAQIAVSLDKHPNIVKVLDSGQFDRICYMAMELVEGLSLDSLIKADKVTPKAGARVLADIADALQYAHDMGIIHRDIKPDNILIDRKSISKLNDFGVAKSLEESGGTMTGVVMGTLAYMAPEQAENSKNVDVRSDVYGLGSVLYTIMTKRPPHIGESAANIMASLMTREPPRPSTINKEIDDKLEKICLKALAKNPDKRFQTAGAFRDALNAYRKGEFGLLESLVPETADSGHNDVNKKVMLIAGIAAAALVLL